MTLGGILGIFSEKRGKKMVLTEKENSILDNAEDAILKQVQLFHDLKTPMETEQCDILHSLIGTLDRICRLKGYRENQ